MSGEGARTSGPWWWRKEWHSECGEYPPDDRCVYCFHGHTRLIWWHRLRIMLRLNHNIPRQKHDPRPMKFYGQDHNSPYNVQQRDRERKQSERGWVWNVALLAAVVAWIVAEYYWG